MRLQLLKHLQIIVWLLLTFYMTSLNSTAIPTFPPIAPTGTLTATDQQTTTNRIKPSSATLSSSASLNHNKRLHLQLQHHQYQQQQYPPPAYQNYPFVPVSNIATELMGTSSSSSESKKSINEQVSMDQQQPQQRQQYSQILTHKMMMMTGSSTTNADNNEHNNNIIDINYSTLNGHHNRRHMIKDTLYPSSSSSSSSMSGERGRNGGGDGEEEGFPKIPQPYFDLTMPRNITARAGQIAAINCRVENLGDKSVSWIRKRDLHILTAGILTYTSDERFKVTRTLDRKQWALHIKYAQPRDSGIYECQVNTEPKMSMAFRLNVIVTPPDAKASISGPTDLYVKVGSAITLTCHIKQPSSAHDIGPIHWYRGPYILTPFVVHPNEAAIDMQRISMESKLGDKLQSRLRISNAQLADSGNYTCMPTTAEAASVMVNVINDESPAAMQKSSAFALKQQLQKTYFNSTTTIIIITILILIQTNPEVLWQIINCLNLIRSSSSSSSSLSSSLSS